MKISRIDIYSLAKELKYFAETIENNGNYFYHVDGVVIEITQFEFNMVKENPNLYYFSTALKLHFAIQRKRENSYFIRELK